MRRKPGEYDLSRTFQPPDLWWLCAATVEPDPLVLGRTFGVEMIQGWGMTETSPLATLSRRVDEAQSACHSQ